MHKLAYDSVAAWLDGNGAVPDGIAAVHGLAENLRLQDRIAQSLKNLRHADGALSLETIEAKPIFDGTKFVTSRPKRRTAPRRSSRIS